MEVDRPAQEPADVLCTQARIRVGIVRDDVGRLARYARLIQPAKLQLAVCQRRNIERSNNENPIREFDGGDPQIPAISGKVDQDEIAEILNQAERLLQSSWPNQWLRMDVKRRCHQADTR